MFLFFFFDWRFGFFSPSSSDILVEYKKKEPLELEGSVLIVIYVVVLLHSSRYLNPFRHDVRWVTRARHSLANTKGGQH